MRYEVWGIGFGFISFVFAILMDHALVDEDK